MLAWRARLKFEMGDWNSASADAEQVLAHLAHARRFRGSPALTILGHLRVLRGDTDASSPLDRARELAERADELQRLHRSPARSRMPPGSTMTLRAFRAKRTRLTR